VRARLEQSRPGTVFMVRCDADVAGHIQRIARWAGGVAEVVENGSCGVLLEICKREVHQTNN